MKALKQSSGSIFQAVLVTGAIILALSGAEQLFAIRRNSRYPALAQAISAPDLLQKVADNELRADRNNHTDWMFKDVKITTGKKTTWEYIETKDGNIERLLCVNGQPLAAAEQGTQKDRISWIVAHPVEARKLLEDQEQDAQKGQEMLSVLPKAVVASYGAVGDTTIELDFTPNPRFQPRSHEQQVFHSMSGKIIVNRKEDRLVEIDGYLSKPVEFWHGILGHLDRGGQFQVLQSEVAPGDWEIVRLHVNMRGKALFFKTIGVQQNEIRSDYREVPGSTSLAQAADMLSQAAMLAKR